MPRSASAGSVADCARRARTQPFRSGEPLCHRPRSPVRRTPGRLAVFGDSPLSPSPCRARDRNAHRTVATGEPGGWGRVPGSPSQCCRAGRELASRPMRHCRLPPQAMRLAPPASPGGTQDTAWRHSSASGWADCPPCEAIPQRPPYPGTIRRSSVSENRPPRLTGSDDPCILTADTPAHRRGAMHGDR